MAETQERRLDEAGQQADATVEELEEHGERVGAGIDHAKKTLDDAQRSREVPTAAGDWEDSEPDDSTGEDPSGFDDPESVDLDDEDDDSLDDDE